MEELDLLILGAGWTATFLIPLLQKHALSFAATTTTGRPVAGHPTIPFRFTPDDPSAIAALPRARTVLVTFPLYGPGPSKILVEGYTSTHQSASAASNSTFRFIQLGSTGIWQGKGGQTFTLAEEGPWVDRHSSYDGANPRAVAEDELLKLGGCVLNLAGLWGGQREPRNWVPRVAKTKEEVKGKKSLHLVHGMDVARGLLEVVRCDGGKWEEHGKGQRWMLTDGFVYDWWALMAGWAEGSDGEVSEQAKWVGELMEEEKVKALPRSMEALGRCYDSREFWRVFGVVPVKARV
ncbi:hypothetical protein QBC34DRAFT_149094 [Podospora aff. communis PSN243]|uniref:Uncharacterized protein n=1 Tax=Podospora aff. communis PSN243 TaxID=3040156 RepID=A0AAV9GFW8_9PEZI|nr:hypothetical protein QBC34DRAFT_149094 [Podospora aff. communis PSN243]